MSNKGKFKFRDFDDDDFNSRDHKRQRREQRKYKQRVVDAALDPCYAAPVESFGMNAARRRDDRNDEIMQSIDKRWAS
jgi:hypothetical protein